jgi:diaminohydroxyphosphoribosylaminopyrimidine deaminase/5-amino-6-(5-phosphoribosylamino)uracil reductase
MEEICREANAGFFTWVTAHRPLITMKVAATLDGYIGDGREQLRPINTRWITGPKARIHAHRLRAQNDAILVGIGTILADNPKLTVRAPGRQKFSNLRIVLDSQLRINPRAACLQTRDAVPPLIVASERAMANPTFTQRKKRIEAQGADVLVLPADRQGRPSLTDLLSTLADRAIQRVLVEGGSTIHGAFIAQGLVDRFVLYLAPRLVGSGNPIARGYGPGWLQPLELGPLTMTPLGKDWVVLGQVQRHNQSKSR